jgi:protein gp37
MSINTNILYCDSTLNLSMGCQGCELWNPSWDEDNNACFAAKDVGRKAGKHKGYLTAFNKPQLYLYRLDSALRWPDLTGTARPQKPWLSGLPRIIFLVDEGDAFTEGLAVDGLTPVWQHIAVSKHIWLLLTKRPHRMAEFLARYGCPDNVWPATSVTSMDNIGRLDELAKIDSPHRWVSREPMLGPLDLSRIDPVAAHWWVVGGESGNGARKSEMSWFRDERDFCQQNKIPFFMKQAGDAYGNHKGADAIPDDLLIRQMPVQPVIATPATPEAAVEVVSVLPARKRSAKTKLAGARKMPGEMSDAELGAALKAPTERITVHVGSAVAHEEQAKTARREAQDEFEQNLPYYFEAKNRLLNPGYRTDLGGGKNRTAEDNVRNFGAPDWQTFVARWGAFSLRHADRLLAKYAKDHGEVADDGDNSNPPNDINTPQRQGRRTEDLIAQKRNEHVAAAAVEIANRNPEGETEKLILAATEYMPAPLSPFPLDIYTDLLNFVTTVSSSTTADENLKTEARRLRGKMLLHRPKPDPEQVLGEAQATMEEKKKRDQRLAGKNGGTLGSEGFKPPTSATSGHVQKSEPMSDAGEEVDSAFSNPAEQKLSQLRLKPEKKYTVRPAPLGDYGVHEVDSTVLLQWHPTWDAAWNAIDAATTITDSVMKEAEAGRQKNRFAKKNGQTPGSAGHKPPTSERLVDMSGSAGSEEGIA